MKINNDFGNKKKYRVLKSGYVFNKRIFQLAIIFLSFCFVVISYTNGFNAKYYYSCDSSVSCDIESMKQFCNEPSFLDKIKYPNRLEWLQGCGLCDGGLVPAGFTCGEKLSFLSGLSSIIVLFIISCSFIINHFLYNKNFDFKEGI